jgi:hypothetical protein
LGSRSGGGLFAAWFAVANEFRVVGWLGGLNVLAGFALCAGFRDRSAAFRLVLLVALAAVAPAWLKAARLERWTDARRFPGQFLVETRRSIYGHLAVVATDRQLAYFENGLLLGAEDEPQASETFAHFSLLAHPAPKRILLIGNGFNGVLGEILKHAPERVDYVELDPELIALARKHAAPVRRAALDDPRVRVECGDGRRFLARARRIRPRRRTTRCWSICPRPARRFSTASTRANSSAQRGANWRRAGCWRCGCRFRRITWAPNSKTWAHRSNGRCARNSRRRRSCRITTFCISRPTSRRRRRRRNGSPAARRAGCGTISRCRRPSRSG